MSNKTSDSRDVEFRRAAPEVFLARVSAPERGIKMSIIHKILRSSIAIALMVAFCLLIGQLMAPPVSAAGPGLMLPDVNWGN